MARQPDPFPSLLARIAKLERDLQQERQRNPFFGSGFHLTGANGIESDDFDGDIDAGDAGTKGWSLNSLRAALGELFLRPGSIGNDALTNPVIPQVARLYAEGFSLTTAYGSKDSSSLTIPEGCTRLLAILSASMYAVNANTTGGSDTFGGDAIYVRATLAGGNTGGSPIGLSGFNGFTTTTSHDSFQLTGLTPGDSVAFGVEGKSGYQAIPAYVDNWVKATATLIWLR